MICTYHKTSSLSLDDYYDWTNLVRRLLSEEERDK
tara:strand:+ start:760 stop:864 length:105 start_codon:yes stop_codon:yes gene_type:complete